MVRSKSSLSPLSTFCEYTCLTGKYLGQNIPEGLRSSILRKREWQGERKGEKERGGRGSGEGREGGVGIYNTAEYRHKTTIT